MTDQKEKGRRDRERTAMACLACQQSHVTCSEGRPCDRCTRRGVECRDGQRKRAKYLEIVPEEALVPPPGQSQLSGPSANLKPSSSDEDLFFIDPTSAAHQKQDQQHQQQQQPGPDPIQALPQNISSSANPLLIHGGFGSESINSEYSFLSNMLDSNPSATTHLHLQSHPTNPYSHDALLPPHPSTQPTGVVLDLARNDQLVRKAKRVYREVVRPYDYREGYHFLVKYIAEHMEKQDIMRICGSLAKFRPSFMAVIMNLSDEDLVFMEKCFQRTLIEYEKLITYSGTPTVVWRRSGEISLVGKEFCLLTDWPHETLLPTTSQQSTYIYQLMDAKSVIEYWERFATAAFDNKNCSWMVRSVLVSPTGRNIPCSVCFTIKRDIFDVPLAVIGNFLPLFQSRKD
ncbi:hypothetical protein BCR33DRAFT_679951 [Rhizoclosmatium globosum]|uniref:Zn(2)-C6 fungal-type domain-containing protein n=1 Tax=Rhizoclosmatium globosum TaxID=329046 RepID=A0A1Y2C935_9FUNG|nr:hypothetical protein BCR33DRAFT_679951 [Rhizoclosmatium globosum]|eukprot:ORY43427.1 hypothetical protein BCR33DRAFT_679951 [Rhizoclosmatium globosum]